MAEYLRNGEKCWRADYKKSQVIPLLASDEYLDKLDQIETSDRNKELVRKYVELNCPPYNVIGDMYGITANRVRQILERTGRQIRARYLS